ncbi:hypothetical protein [Dyadobacter psychrotolerans]|uniref:Uncharacterized protein n=1 Tax=Dyadobacter psychrotolerans TaxID=2541721 RepID=A0A4V2Z356_9BACT|nr:hypothetical protein [Dyadobacter psychrotolerans]TDE11298.1 hypothetical protein E0F88_25640 [Dyadobacter psychrotolerans]
MEKNRLPANGSVIRFMRTDENEWKEGEFDEQNQMFIEIYSTELVTHNSSDILKWEYLEDRE